MSGKMERRRGLGRGKGMFAAASLDGATETGREPRTSPPDGNLAYAVPITDFGDFYRRTRPDIAKALALSIGDLDLATEATDEALARAFERWSAVAGLDRPEAWVYRVASNWAMSVFRRRARSLHRLYQPDAADAAAVADPSVHAAVAALDVKHRSVVVCRHLMGWTVTETATALGVSEGTVKSRLHRANAILRTRLHDLDPAREARPTPRPEDQ